MEIPLGASARAISAACFRLLSLQRETQNEVDVLKPILEEREVLRLSCALGALTNVNPKDFEHDFLEAREFDDDFAHFLRSDVFGSGANGDGPVVRVQGLFGKQVQVKSHLETIGAWDQAMEVALQPRDMGLYAVVMPCGFAPDNIKMVVVFSWLMDEYLHLDTLRGTPTYLMRLLTCLTPHVTCCLSEEDKKVMEDIARFGSEDEEDDDEWDSYSVGFHVAQQQDARDDVKSAVVNTLSFPELPEATRKIDILKGSFPALMAIAEAPPTTTVTKDTKRFGDVTQLCDWLADQSDRFDLRTGLSAQSWSLSVQKVMLHRFHAWPAEKLVEIDVRFDECAAGIEEECRQELHQGWDKRRATLERAADDVFRVESMTVDVEGSINMIRNIVHDLRGGGSFGPSDEESVKIRNLPLRFPKLLKYLLGVFQCGEEERIRLVLAKAHLMSVKDLAQEDKSLLDRVNGFVTRFLGNSRETQELELSDAVHQRMTETCGILKSLWWSEVTEVMDAHCNYLLKEAVERKRRELHRECDAQSEEAVHDAFCSLLNDWSETSHHGVCLKVNNLVDRYGSSILCFYEEEKLVPSCDQLHVWSMKDRTPRVPGQPTFELLGVVNLAVGETVTRVFTVQARSLLAVTSISEKNDLRRTHVRRFEFPSNVWGSSPPSVTMIRDLPRHAILSDFYAKERLLVLSDVAGLVGIYRVSESFKSLEVVRSVDASLKTSLEMPLKSVLLNDGILYMVDCCGAIQSMNTRNQQTSRKQPLPGNAAGSSRLLRVLDGDVMGYLASNEAQGHHAMHFIATDTLRQLPQSTQAQLSVGTTADSPGEAVGNLLFLANTATKEVHVIKLEVTLQSDSYRIQKVRDTNRASGDHATSSNGNASVVDKHWLWVLYHLYEKFPVRGQLFSGSRNSQPLDISLVCDATRGHEGTLIDQGSRALLRMIMEKLLLLNKPMFGLNLGECVHQVFCRGDADEIKAEYCSTTPQVVAALVRELITFVPVQICRAEFNTLMLMSDGKVKSQDNLEGSALSSADIARTLRFGLLSPLLTSWRERCIVITSMGKQSTGKSYFLNHLTGSSFAIAGARCTDGAWMSVRVLPSNVLLVVIDFEGLGSFERTEQEDVFLSVLNASVSMLTIFRMEMRFDREVDELFSKFQKGSQLLKKDPQLFQGKLYMAVKDVNPNDKRGVIGEFETKFQKLLEANKEHNFLTDMYAGQLEINCSPPLGTVGYSKSLAHTQRFIERRIFTDPKTGFASGKSFLDCIRLMLAKISILDWTSLDESAIKFKIAEVTQKLPGVLRFGCIGDGTLASSAAEELVHASTNAKIVISVDEMCAANTSMASKWRELDAWLNLDQIEDQTIDLGECISSPSPGMDKIQAASLTVQLLFAMYRSRVEAGGEASVSVLKQSMQVEFDAFFSFVVRRRCIRVQKWCHATFNEIVPEGWQAVEQQALEAVKTLLGRCHSSCSRCQLGCMKVSAHSSNGDSNHDCSTSHICAGACEYCRDLISEGETPSCSKPAGHEGKCECATGDHTCRDPCVLNRANNCGQFCAKKAGHDDSHEHRCSVGLHKCGEPCAAQGCSRLCVLDIEVPHTVHKCEADQCIAKCIMDGCTRTCSSKDHFHGLGEAKVAFAVENAGIACKSSDTFDTESDKPTIHMCDESHACPEMCEHDGICHIDVFLKQSAKTYAGARDSFQYTYQEMNGSRKKCSHTLVPGQMSHTEKHSCCGSANKDARKDIEEEGKFEEEEDESTDRVSHYCNVRCPSCSYYCQKQHGHTGAHKTTHGNMRNTMFLSDDKEIDLIDRKYAAGESGMAEMCNLYCSKMGRGHMHYLDCEQQSETNCVYKGDSEDMRRHCTRALEPKPDKEQDEVLHERFWDTLGWEDPCASVQEREEFAKCAYKCDAEDHEGKQESYCCLPAWHLPALGPANGASDGFSYVSGHQFECSHVTTGNKMHHVFVLDSSGSMGGNPWNELLGAFDEYLGNRITIGATEDLVSVITFANSASIAWEAKKIGEMVHAEVPFLNGGTSFDAGLRLANEVLSRVSFEQYKPVIVFFSDGYPNPGDRGQELATHIASTYSKFGLAAFAVGFGSINLSVLEQIAERLGGSYRHVITGDELKMTFHKISASLGTRAGLALTKPQHDKECVICLSDLASGATTVLVPCQHQLHQRCYREFASSVAEGAILFCPTCRQEITTV